MHIKRIHPATDKGRKTPGIRVRLPYLVLAALMALFAFSFIQKTREIRQLRQQEAALRYQNQLTADQNARLQRNIAYYRTNPYIENEARAIFGYTKSGEVAVEVKPSVVSVVAVRAAPHVRPAPAVPVWKQWWHAFFG